VQLASNGIITNEDTLAKHPEWVRNMTTAFLKGLADTIAEIPMKPIPSAKNMFRIWPSPMKTHRNRSWRSRLPYGRRIGRVIPIRQAWQKYAGYSA